MTQQQPKRTWHVANVGGAWRVYDPEQRQHGGRFATADDARAYMAQVQQPRREAVERDAVEVMA